MTRDTQPITQTSKQPNNHTNQSTNQPNNPGPAECAERLNKFMCFNIMEVHLVCVHTKWPSFDVRRSTRRLLHIGAALTPHRPAGD